MVHLCTLVNVGLIIIYYCHSVSFEIIFNQVDFVALLKFDFKLLLHTTTKIKREKLRSACEPNALTIP